MKDLEPYTCVFTGCEIPQNMYEGKDEWFEHEAQHLGGYHCGQPDHTTFADILEFQSHMECEHGIASSALAVTDTSTIFHKRTNQSDAETCPLCKEVTTTLKHHLGRHLERIALFAIPRNYEDDDREAARSDDAQVSVGVLDDSHADHSQQTTTTSEDNEDLNSEHWFERTSPSDFVAKYQVGSPASMAIGQPQIDAEASSISVPDTPADFSWHSVKPELEPLQNDVRHDDSEQEEQFFSSSDLSSHDLASLSAKIIPFPGMQFELNLQYTGRQLLASGALGRAELPLISSAGDVGPPRYQPLSVFLFDNCLLLTRRILDHRRSSNAEHQYHIVNEPIPIELLVLYQSDPNSTKFKILRLGDPNSPKEYEAETMANRLNWIDSISTAQSQYAARVASQRFEPFSLGIISDSAFAYEINESTIGVLPPMLIAGTPLYEVAQHVAPDVKPICRSVVHAAVCSREDNQQLWLVGTDFGIFVASGKEPRNWLQVSTQIRSHLQL